MIASERQLRLQAWVDGELSPTEAAEVEQWTAQDAEARVLAAELRRVRSWLQGAEVARPVPETREFYWSQIRRGIEREAGGRAPEGQPRSEAPAAWWQWWLAPAGALAAIVFLLLVVSGVGRRSAQLAVLHEIETPLEQINSITFRSERARMTVVWVDYQLR